MPIQFEPLKKWTGDQLWTEYMNEQNENVDLLNEKLELLETSEGLRDTAETARDTAEGIRESNESARKSAETIRESAETARETAYGLAEDARDGQYNAAEGARDTAYGQAESARDGLYTTAEDARNTAYGQAEDARDGQYSTAEGARTTAFNTAETTRNANEVARGTAEGTRSSNETTRIANENARAVFEAYSSSKNYVIGNKVAYGGSSYRALKASKGITPGADSTTWLLIAKKGDTGDISNLTATHISNALGFLPIEYSAGINVSIDPVTGAISATDTVYDDTGVQQALAGLSDRLDNVKANDLAARREILDIKLKLDEMQIVDYLNKTGVGFYDLFTSLAHVDTTRTTASVNIGENHVVFSGSKELVMLPQVFDQLASIELSIYDKDREKIDVTANSSTNSVEILVEPGGVAIGDRFMYGDKVFTVTNVN